MKLHYQVHGAGWEPTYQASLNTETNQLNIIASAIIAQQTRENWSNVPVTLSLPIPIKTRPANCLDVTRFSLYEEDRNNRNIVNVPPMSENMPVVVSGREEYGGAIDTKWHRCQALLLAARIKMVLLNIGCRNVVLFQVMVGEYVQLLESNRAVASYGFVARLVLKQLPIGMHLHRS